MSEFLVPPDPTPDRTPAPRRTHAATTPASRARPFPAATVRVAPVPGGVRLTFAPADGHMPADALVAALADVVERERRDGTFLRCAVEVQPDGAAVSLTITGPSVLRAPAAAPCRVRRTPPART